MTDPFAAPGEQPAGDQPAQPPAPPPPAPGYGPPPPGYGVPAAGYGQPYGGGPGGWPPGPPKTNVLAIISLVGAFFCAPVGLICGIIAMGQIKTSGEQGRGLALAGVIISVASVVIGVLAFAALVSFSGTTSY